jgi:hypothetical protein
MHLACLQHDGHLLPKRALNRWDMRKDLQNDINIIHI